MFIDQYLELEKYSDTFGHFGLMHLPDWFFELLYFGQNSD